jgi:hypothetical protein
MKAPLLAVTIMAVMFVAIFTLLSAAGQTKGCTVVIDGTPHSISIEPKS